jgi:hypothetical protein
VKSEAQRPTSRLLSVYSFGHTFFPAVRAILKAEFIVLPIPPTIGPARLRQTPAGLCVVISSRFSWYKFLYAPLAAVLVSWYLQLTRENSTPVLLVIAVLVGISTRKWWREVLGQQMITVNKVAVTVRNNVGFIGQERTYFVNRISNLRFVRIVTSADRQAGFDSRPGVGNVTFYYDSGIHKLAGRFTDPEAHELIDLLKAFSAAPLTEISPAPASNRPLPSGTIAEELHRGRGGLILYGWLGGAIYAMCLPIDDIPAVRFVSCILGLLALAVGVLAECGYRYRFTPSGLEILTLGFQLRFIPVDQIVHYEQAKWTPRDRWNFGIYGRRRSFLWGGPGVRIQTLDGEVYLGHELPQKIIADLDRMKLSASNGPTANAASAANR